MRRLFILFRTIISKVITVAKDLKRGEERVDSGRERKKPAIEIMSSHVTYCAAPTKGWNMYGTKTRGERHARRLKRRSFAA